jgi:hypothetical protein
MSRHGATFSRNAGSNLCLEDNNRIEFGFLKMTDGTIARFAEVYHAFTMLSAYLKRPDGGETLRDMYKLATGQAISPQRQALLRDKLEVRKDGTLVEPTARLLLLSYREDPQGNIHLEDPWTANDVNMEVIRRGLLKQYERLEDLIRRGPNDDSDVPTWGRN